MLRGGISRDITAHSTMDFVNGLLGAVDGAVSNAGAEGLAVVF